MNERGNVVGIGAARLDALAALLDSLEFYFGFVIIKELDELNMAYSERKESMKNITIPLLLGCVFCFQAYAQVSFAPPVKYSVGPQPQGIVAADINGDGKVDLISANTGDNSLTILTNNGTGGFALSSSPGVGSDPVYVTAADVNGDGKMDLITANYGANTLTILTNDGRGGFALASTPTVGTAPFWVATADVNGDGKIDLIAANNGSPSLSVLTNDGAGGFVLASSPVLGSFPAGVIAVDLYKNGGIELVCANNGDNNLAIMTNGGFGRFSTSSHLSVGGGPIAVIAADVNGDGYLDLITANNGGGGGNSLTILTNNGNGGFALASSPQVGQGPFGVIAADLTGDGSIDLVSVNIGGNSLTVLTNDGSGNFGLAATLNVDPSPFQGAVADVNGDGIPDLIATSRGNSTVSVLRNISPIFVPKITAQPQTQLAMLGTNATFTVIAQGKSPLNYQWYSLAANNAVQAGAYAQTIGGSFVYGVVVTNGGFGYGNTPNVSFAGGGGSGAAGYVTVSNGVVTSIALTNAGYGYTNPPAVVIGPPNGVVFGQTNSTLTVSNVNANSLGNYFVVISNNYGSVTSSVANIVLVYPPSITMNPSGFIANYLSSNSLSVLATGTPPLSFQWFLNGTNINGATGSNYFIPKLNLTNAGTYVVEVANPFGTVYSSPANVYVAPALTSPFTGAIGVWGQDAVLSVGAIGSGSLNFQWYFNGVAILDATNNSFALNNIQFTNAGLYNVVVSSAYGNVTNTAYQVVVNPANIALGTCPIIYITGTAGYTYTIQSTTDLTDSNAWVTATNLTIPYTPYIWADTATDTTKPSNPRRFYRVIAGP